MVSVLSVTINVDLTRYEFKSQLTASVLKKDETDKKLTRIVCFLEGGGGCIFVILSFLPTLPSTSMGVGWGV